MKNLNTEIIINEMIKEIDHSKFLLDLHKLVEKNGCFFQQIDKK